MASTNDNLFTSFPNMEQVLRFPHKIGAKGGQICVEFTGGRLQRLSLERSVLSIAPENGDRIAAWFEWLSLFEAAKPSAQWELLAPDGTAFQRTVWRGLLEVGWGKRISYGALAGMLGRPRAVRAVASAVAANPIALLIPCHRIVRADGQVGGYRWGRALKETLLELEAGRRTWGELLWEDSLT